MQHYQQHNQAGTSSSSATGQPQLHQLQQNKSTNHHTASSSSTSSHMNHINNRIVNNVGCAQGANSNIVASSAKTNTTREDQKLMKQQVILSPLVTSKHSMITIHHTTASSSSSSSSYKGIPPPIASGDLPNARDATALEDVTVTGDSTLKDACVKECKLGLCGITGELNKVNDAIKEAAHEQSEDIKALLNDNDGYKFDIDVDDCYDKYEIKISYLLMNIHVLLIISMKWLI